MIRDYLFTRRDLLLMVLLAAICAGLGRETGAQQAVKTDPNRWVLMADTHVWEVTDRPRSDTFPAKNLAAAIQQYTQLAPKPAGAIIAGDCVAISGEPGDYAVLRETIAPFEEKGVPIYFVLGNHDNRETLYAAFPDRRPTGEAVALGKHVRIIETPHANWFLLDSLEKTNSTPGLLGEAQLQWLAKELDARPDRPAIVVAHHPPAFGRRHADPDAPNTSALQDTEELLDVIRPRKQVKAYVFGHSHRWRHETRDGIHFVNIPAMGWLFGGDEPRAWVLFDLNADGATLTLQPIDPRDQRTGQTVELDWRE